MPFSTSKEFFFVRISKTAGMYLMRALNDSIEDLVDAEKNYFPPMQLNGVNHGDHFWLRDIQDGLMRDPEKFNKHGLTLEKFERFKKFGIVRNPYSRILSFLSFTKRDSIKDYTPEMFKRDVMNLGTGVKSYHLRQTDFLFAENGDCLADKVFKLEDPNLIQSIEQYLCLEIERYLPTQKVNATSNRNYSIQEYYSDKIIQDRVYEFFELEFNSFGYEYELS